jgi:hypothetical protein
MDLDVLATDVRNLKGLLANLTPLMPVLTKLAQNPKLIEQLADDAGDLARDIAALSAAVGANRSDVAALKDKVAHVEDMTKAIAAIGERVSALERAAVPAHAASPHHHDEEPPQPGAPQGDESMAQQARDFGAGSLLARNSSGTV